jgi:N-acyl-D-amino-acid deacylase
MKPMENFDLVIRNALVMDPASDHSLSCHMGIRKGQIAALMLEPPSGQVEIDAHGMVVAPGFIDIHTHADGVIESGEIMARCGVTTAIGGNCGMFFGVSRAEMEKIYADQEDILSLVESQEGFKEFFDRMDKQGFPVNLGMLIGGWSARQRAGLKDRFVPANPGQVDHMVEIAEDALSHGAFGISFGLAYVPGTTPAEIQALFSASARHDGIAAVHPRYSAHGFPGVELDGAAGEVELIEATRLTQAKLQISHLAHQIAYPSRSYDALLQRGLQNIEQARKDGLDVMADCLPSAIFGVTAGEPFLETLSHPAFAKLYGVTLQQAFSIISGPFAGQNLTPQLFQRLRQEAPNTKLIGFLMSEDLMARCLIQPYVMICNDSSTTSFPAQLIVLGKWVRERKVLTLMEALYKMSTLPARRLGLKNKGHLMPGADADLVIFDPQKIGAEGDTAESLFDLKGLEFVIVNGVPVIEHGKYQNKHPGKMLRHQPWLS